MKNTSFFTRIGILCVFVASLMLLPSCEKRELRSLSKMIKEEKKNISQFINEQGIQTEKTKEGRTEFQPNVYYQYPNGLYMCVIDPGKEKAVPGKTHVRVRFKGYLFTSKKGIEFDNLSEGGYQNSEFIYIDQYVYGAKHMQLLPAAPGNNLNNLLCEGIAYPLTAVGNGARVRLIIPFLIGPDLAFTTGSTMFCQEVRYEFIEN